MKTIAKILCFSLMAGIILPAKAYDIRSGLLSYYSFNTTTTDDSAFTNNFTAIAAPTLVTTNTGDRASVLQLNGTSQYLRMDHTPDNSVNGFPIYKAVNYSIAFWVKGAAQTSKYIFTSGNSTNSGTSVAYFVLETGTTAGANDKLAASIRVDGATVHIGNKTSSSVVFDNTWHHVAWVDSNGTVKL